MMDVSGDLEVFFEEFGVPVVFQGQAVNGNFDTPASMYEKTGPGSMEQQSYVLLLPANAFINPPKPTEFILVDGVNYRVLDRTYLDDGKLMQLDLKVGLV